MRAKFVIYPYDEKRQTFAPLREGTDFCSQKSSQKQFLIKARENAHELIVTTKIGICAYNEKSHMSAPLREGPNIFVPKKVLKNDFH